MHAINPVIQLAKERALFRFSSLALCMLQDAHTSITQLIPAASSSAEQKTISAAKEWMATQGPVFLKRLNVSYFGYVERAMQTMYRDLRQGLQDVSGDTLALIDDDTIMRQIEVERRVLRLRDADQQSLGRLNLMIAQLHDEHDVRERENPFRPYLMARALHDVLCEMTSTADLCTMLFDHMSGALASHLPEYLTAIREVFESNGVHARLLVRPASLTKHDRAMLSAPHQNSPGTVYVAGTNFQNNFPAPGNGLASPALERVLSLLQQRPADAHDVMRTPQQDSQAALQDFVWKIFNQSAPGRMPPHPRFPDGAVHGLHNGDVAGASFKPDTHPLASQLQQLQQGMATEAIGDDTASGAVPLLDLDDVLETEEVSALDRVAIDVVAMLFNFIGSEALIPTEFRTLIMQLQIPFLKATMFAPEILQHAGHPLRQLLNRMASVAIGLEAETSPGTDIRAGMALITGGILADFNEDMTVFDDALEQLNLTVEKALRAADAEVSRAIDALEAAEKNPHQHDVLVVQTINALRERLSTIATDPRVVDFIIRVWSRVLVYVSEHEEIDSQPYREVMPDLIWSTQEELDVSERSTLMGLLPKLVRRIKDGLQLIRMSDDESKQVLDELVAMHARVLRAIKINPAKKPIALISLHRHFSTLQIGGTKAEFQAICAPMVPHIRLQAALQEFNVSAQLHLDSDVGTLLSSDIKWLAGMQPGTSVERWVNNGYLPATLMWVNQQKSFYLFKLTGRDESPRLLIYSSISLIKALREGSIGMIEYAPIFVRAMESLLNTENVQQAIPG